MRSLYFRPLRPYNPEMPILIAADDILNIEEVCRTYCFWVVHPSICSSVHYVFLVFLLTRYLDNYFSYRALKLHKLNWAEE